MFLEINRRAISVIFQPSAEERALNPGPCSPA